MKSSFPDPVCAAQFEVVTYAGVIPFTQSLMRRQLGAAPPVPIRITFIFFDADCAPNHTAFAVSTFDQLYVCVQPDASSWQVSVPTGLHVPGPGVPVSTWFHAVATVTPSMAGSFITAFRNCEC